jgi:hypothetical protein
VGDKSLIYRRCLDRICTIGLVRDEDLDSVALMLEAAIWATEAGLIPKAAWKRLARHRIMRLIERIDEMEPTDLRQKAKQLVGGSADRDERAAKDARDRNTRRER